MVCAHSASGCGLQGATRGLPQRAGQGEKKAVLCICVCVFTYAQSLLSFLLLPKLLFWGQEVRHCITVTPHPSRHSNGGSIKLRLA